MYRAVVFYFSATGNTWWVADKIKKELDAKNINADTVSIDSIDARKANWWIKTADLIFFGWPVFGCDLPEPMKRFIGGLYINEKGKHIHTFCTQKLYSFDGAWLYHKFFKNKGLIIDSAEHFKMPNHNPLFGTAHACINEKKNAKIMNNCERQIAQYVNKMMIGRSKIKGRCSYPLGMLCRGLSRVFSRRHYFSLGVDNDRCDLCGLCESLCPVSNISMAPYPQFAEKCAHCMRCYAFCPACAITVNGKLRDINKSGVPYTLNDKRFKPIMLK
ncbi:MAG: EFR1 family ferrodoxin [Christensenellales bacterium]